MAKTKLNAGLKALRGELSGFVYKQYAYGTVVSRQPRMKHIKPSPAQLAQRERFRQAAKFHRQVLADPTLKRRYMTLARKRHMPLSAVTLGAYFNGERTAARS